MPRRVSADPRVSIIIPALDEGEAIVPCLDRILEAVTLPCEILVVVDDLADSTCAAVDGAFATEGLVRVVVNDCGRGPANAIRYGIDHARAPVVLVTMADGSDDPRMIDDLARLVERGVVVAAASRYCPGGQQVGGPAVKGFLSRFAGRSLYVVARVGTRDATNSFKAYSTAFVREVGIDSRHGFEIGLELTAKARRLRRPIAEIPTIWLDRAAGISSFKIASSIPHYLFWYRFAFGPSFDIETMNRRLAKGGLRRAESAGTDHAEK
jgi:dolichol-phosphate mannosyltransferase